MQKSAESPERPEQPKRRTRLVLLPIAMFIALAALLGYALSSADPSNLPSALLGKPAPATELPGLPDLVTGGQPVPGITTADLARGDVTVVNFWASWCLPCVQEHPILTELKKRTNVRMLGVNYKDPGSGGLKFLLRHGNPFDAVGVDGNGRASIEWGVYGMPETFVVDGRGRIAYKHVGPITPELMTRVLIPAIEKAKSAK